MWSKHRAGERIGQHGGGDAADLQARGRSGSTSSWVGVVAVTVTPRAAASRAMTRSVTSSWVSQRRSCLPSLVCGRGSAGYPGARRAVPPRGRRPRPPGPAFRRRWPPRRRGSPDRHRDRGGVQAAGRAADLRATQGRQGPSPRSHRRAPPPAAHRARARAVRSQVPHGLGGPSTARVGAGVGADGDAQPGGSPGRRRCRWAGDQPTSSDSASPISRPRHTSLDALPPRGRDVPGQLEVARTR